MSVTARALRKEKARQRQPLLKSVQWRNWNKGVNRTDARTAIDDDELFHLENAITIGKGAIQILNGPGTSVATYPVAVVANGCFGMTLNGVAVNLTVHSDGSLRQTTVPGGVITLIAAAGTESTSARIFGPWQGTTALIVDPTFGYFSWNGTNFVVIDATKTATGGAVFEGRAFIFTSRTTQITAPNTYNDFTAANGATSFVLTDEAFPGNIIDIHSALEQLWFTGQGAIDAVSNVTSTGVAPAVVTTFSVTNIVTSLGSNAPSSVIGYFRALALLAPFGAYALSGVTPQKLSDKLDGLFPKLTLTGDVPAAIAVVQNLLCLLFLVTYTDNDFAAGNGPQQILIGFTQGKWFFGAQGALTAITTVIVGGVAQCWGTTGTDCVRVFGASDATAVTYKVVSKLYDGGSVVSRKSIYKLGVEIQASAAVNPMITADTELTSSSVTLSFSNELTLINNALAPLTLLNSLNQPLTLVGQGLVLTRGDASLSGFYFGWTISGTDVPFRIGSVAMQYFQGKPWTG
jgi:hypothetical protein